jgi:DNA-binding NarL/FixJ family response regulator
MSRKLRLLLCDDHALFRASMRRPFTSSPTKVLGEAGKGVAALTRSSGCGPTWC